MAYLQPDKPEKVYLPFIKTAKQNGEKLVCLTAYDYPTARIVDEAGVDIILVGDSIGNVIHGYGNTIPVSLDEITSACIAVKRGTERAMVVADMPYGSYHVNEDESVRNALRLMKYGGLTPQSVYKMGGYRVQGRTAEQAKRLIEDAKMLEDAGAFAIVLELVPREVASMITREIKISTIGIGAGLDCDIQVLVLHDLLGMTFGRQPRFVRQYVNLRDVMTEAVQRWANDVKTGAYPNENESYGLTDETKAELTPVMKRSSSVD